MKSALDRWHGSRRSREGGEIDCNNIAAPTSDGQLAEAFFCGSIIIASRLGGIKGVDGLEFLNNFLLQCLDFDGKIEFADAEISDYLKSLSIPFMSPPNQEFPKPVCELFDLLNIQGGNMSRSTQKERIDCACVSTSGKVILTGESKDHKRIALDKMQDIILRVPLETPLHIVFSNTLQGDYFRDTTYDAWSEDELKKAIVIKKMADEKKKAKESGVKYKEKNIRVQITEKMKQGSREFQKRKNAVFVKVGKSGKVVPICKHLSSTWSKDVDVDQRVLVLFIERGISACFVIVLIFRGFKLKKGCGA
jgi:hypothetical protein